MVPDPGVESVGQEDHRPAAKFLLQKIGIEPGLLAARRRVLTGALGLYQSQWASVSAQQDVIHEALAGGVGHPLHRVFVQPVGAFCPARVLEHGVDVELPGLVLGEVQGFGDVGRLLLLPPLGQLADLFRSRLVESDRSLCRRKGFAVYDHRVFQLRQQGGVEVHRLIVRVVAAGDKIQKIKEILQSQTCLVPGDLFRAMGGGVA